MALSFLLKTLTRRSFWIAAGALWILGNDKRRKRALIIAGSSIVAIVIAGELTLDHRHLPWRPLGIDDRAGLATEFKLRLINLGPDSWCDDLLEASALLDLTRMEEHEGDGRCGWPHAYHLNSSDGTTLSGNSTYPMRCNLAVGAHIWMRGMNYHAENLLGSRLKRVRHYGTYSCRRINNQSTGKLSQHAFAKAWDVAAFELEDGRVISIQDSWSGADAKSRFLKAVHKDACRIFNVTLGPDYNALHHDHFHVDVGSGLSCR